MFRVNVLQSHKQETIFYTCTHVTVKHSLTKLTAAGVESESETNTQSVIPEPGMSLVCHFMRHKHRP